MSNLCPPEISLIMTSARAVSLVWVTWLVLQKLKEVESRVERSAADTQQRIKQLAAGVPRLNQQEMNITHTSVHIIVLYAPCSEGPRQCKKSNTHCVVTDSALKAFDVRCNGYIDTYCMSSIEKGLHRAYNMTAAQEVHNHIDFHRCPNQHAAGLC